MTDKRVDDCDRSIFTLDKSITYQIKIAGQLSENWSDWMEKIDIQIETDRSGFSTTTLTGSIDQAALQGLLRRLYYLGYPLISVNCFQLQEKDSDSGSSDEITATV
jgi:hypothetical protein